MFDFRRMTLFCLEKRLSKHKMTIFSKTLGCPPATPMVTTDGFILLLVRKHDSLFSWQKQHADPCLCLVTATKDNC